MSKTIKIATILLIIFLVLFTTSTIIFAATNVNGIVAELERANSENITGITHVGGQIINILTTVGIVVAVITLLILGIKYMIGSASEKAEYKKTMIPYVVGMILLLGASAIVKALASFKIV